MSDLSTFFIFLSVRLRFAYGDQFGNKSQTWKNCRKTGQSRESVNCAKMPQNVQK